MGKVGDASTEAVSLPLYSGIYFTPCLCLITFLCTRSRSPLGVGVGWRGGGGVVEGMLVPSLRSLGLDWNWSQGFQFQCTHLG